MLVIVTFHGPQGVQVPDIIPDATARSWTLRDQAMQDTYWNSGICLLPGYKPYVTPILIVTVEMLRWSVPNLSSFKQTHQL